MSDQSQPVPITTPVARCVCEHPEYLHWKDDGISPTGRCDAPNCGCHRYRPPPIVTEFNVPAPFDNDPLMETSLSYSELLALINRTRGKNFFLHVSQFTRFKDQSPDTFATGFQGLETSANVHVTKPALRQFLKNAFICGRRERCVIRVWECSNCIFVGSST